MSDKPTHRLTSDEVDILKFVARRRLTRWSNKRELDPRQREQRATLVCTLGVLEDRVFADGCELRASRED